LPLLSPIIHGLITFLPYELKVFCIWDQHFTCLISFYLYNFISILIIPSISVRSVTLSTPYLLIWWYFRHWIFGNLINVGSHQLALNQPIWSSKLLDWKSSNNYCRSFQMNSFMLNSHKDNPKVSIPANWFLLRWSNNL
jgi:hypothetical protein